MKAVKVAYKDAEKARKSLVSLGILSKKYRPVREDHFVLFPLNFSEKFNQKDLLEKGVDGKDFEVVGRDFEEFKDNKNLRELLSEILSLRAAAPQTITPASSRLTNTHTRIL